MDWRLGTLNFRAMLLTYVPLSWSWKQGNAYLVVVALHTPSIVAYVRRNWLRFGRRPSQGRNDAPCSRVGESVGTEIKLTGTGRKASLANPPAHRDWGRPAYDGKGPCESVVVCSNAFVTAPFSPVTTGTGRAP